MFRVGIVDDGNMLCLSSFLHKMCKAQLMLSTSTSVVVLAIRVIMSGFCTASFRRHRIDWQRDEWIWYELWSWSGTFRMTALAPSDSSCYFDGDVLWCVEDYERLHLITCSSAFAFGLENSTAWAYCLSSISTISAAYQLRYSSGSLGSLEYHSSSKQAVRLNTAATLRWQEVRLNSSRQREVNELNINNSSLHKVKLLLSNYRGALFPAVSQQKLGRGCNSRWDAWSQEVGTSITGRNAIPLETKHTQTTHMTDSTTRF